MLKTKVTIDDYVEEEKGRVDFEQVVVVEFTYHANSFDALDIQSVTREAPYPFDNELDGLLSDSQEEAIAAKCWEEYQQSLYAKADRDRSSVFEPAAATAEGGTK